MSIQCHRSWRQYPKVHQANRMMLWRNSSLPLDELGDKKVISYGNRRSYGDSCLNDDEDDPIVYAGRDWVSWIILVIGAIFYALARE